MIYALILKIRRIFSLIRLVPYYLLSHNGAENERYERYRRSALTTVFTIIASVVSMATTFISVPLTLHYLGVERYGLWMTISTIVMFMGFMDLGLGNGLVNAISHASGRQEINKVQKAIASVFYILVGCSIFLFILFAASYFFIPWQYIYNISSFQGINEAGPATAILIICFLINLILSIAQKVQIGYQEGYVNNFWQIIGNITGLIAIIVTIKLNGGLPWLVMAISGLPLIATAINGYNLFYIKRRELLPNWKNFDYATGQTLIKSGFFFFLLWLVNILGTSTDKLIIAQFLGAEEVAKYAIVEKLFSIILLVQFVTVPLWPAFGEAIAKRDFVWAQRTFKYAAIVTFLLSSIICIFLFAFAKDIIQYWVGQSVNPSLSLIAGYSLYRYFTGLGEVAVPVLLTGSFVRKLLLISFIAALVSFTLKIVFISIWQTSSSIAWAAAIAYGFCFTLPACWIAKCSIKELR
jgi:O-antigen/teichoic acid export membrane protein